MQIAKVLIAATTQQLDRLFDFEIPAELVGLVCVGSRVIVSFQNRQTVGYVWELAEQSEFENLKLVLSVTETLPVLSKVQQELVTWLAEYYFCTRAEVVKLCLPPGNKLGRELHYYLNVTLTECQLRLEKVFQSVEVEQILNVIKNSTKAEWTAKEWQRRLVKIESSWDFLQAEKLVVSRSGLAKAKINPKQQKLYHWVNFEQRDKTPTGERVREVLQEKPEGLSKTELVELAAVSASVIERLVRQGMLLVETVSVTRVPAGLNNQISQRKVNLNSEQQQAYDEIIAQAGAARVLLHGVTGSGKTEVYFEVAATFLAQGRQVLYLVPEIALTPQMLARAQARFGEQVAILHSRLSDGERFDQWQRIKHGEARFLLGARSALFAPFEDLGLIVMDEEHESTYKQEETPRYHAHKVAEKLAELTGAKLVLGSATPGIETFFAGQQGRYRYLPLIKRYNQKSLPPVELVDMRAELKSGNKNILSTRLREELETALARGEQALLLLNRRGYSTFVLCRDCGQALKCPACDVSLTYHLNQDVLRCHYCDYRQRMPDVCPQCKSVRIKYFGHGTQKLEEELTSLFPRARLVRMDLDSTSRKDAHYEIYKQLTTGNFDILLGTQMIAKGLDLPKVTLVGAISADATLNIPDFRAAERTFQLLTQVAGRAGRGELAGKVIFQTYDPGHYSLQLAQTHDYLNFYEREIIQRETMSYPPYVELMKLAFSGLDQRQVATAAVIYCKIIKDLQEKLVINNEAVPIFELLGPAPALIPKVQDRYRWHLLLKSSDSKVLTELTKDSWALFPFKQFQTVRIIRDRNPYSSL